jgi:hypothetical protein
MQLEFPLVPVTPPAAEVPTVIANVPEIATEPDKWPPAPPAP